MSAVPPRIIRFTWASAGFAALVARVAMVVPSTRVGAQETPRLWDTPTGTVLGIDS